METFSGTHEEIGRALGAFYARQGVVFKEPPDEGLLAEQIAYYEKEAPEILAELHGIAAESGAPFKAVANRFLAEEVNLIRALQSSFTKSCSIGGYLDGKGESWIVRNYDWLSVIADRFQIRRFETPEATLVMISDMGILAPDQADTAHQIFVPDDCVNAKGLYIGLTFSYCWNTGIGLTSFDALRLAAERCSTVDEVLAFFERARLCCAKNYFIADKKGAMAVVQHASNDHEILRPDADGILVLTNHYQQRLKPQNCVPNVKPHTGTFTRETRLRADLLALKQSGKAGSFEALDPLMTSPETPVCQCVPEMNLESVWTLLGAPMRGSYRVIGAPRSSARRITDFSLA